MFNTKKFTEAGILEIAPYSRRYLSTKAHLAEATKKLKEAAEAMEVIDIDKACLDTVCDMATKMATAGSRIKRIERNEKLINKMKNVLLDNMSGDKWYKKYTIKRFLSNYAHDILGYPYVKPHTDPYHHIDVLLDRLVIDGALASITRDGNTYYRNIMAKEEF